MSICQNKYLYPLSRWNRFNEFRYARDWVANGTWNWALILLLACAFRAHYIETGLSQWLSGMCIGMEYFHCAPMKFGVGGPIRYCQLFHWTLDAILKTIYYVFGLLNTPCKCTSECNSVCPKQQSKHCKYWYGLPLLLTIRFASIKQFMKTNIGCCWFFSYYFFGVIAYLYICVLKLYLISFCLTDFNGWKSRWKINAFNQSPMA